MSYKYRSYLLLLLVLIQNVSCSRKGEDSDYILPQGFQGNVIILFNQLNGESAFKEEGRRVYLIDSTGVLKTQFAQNYGRQENRFFTIDKQGKRLQVQYFPSVNQVNSSKLVVTNKEVGTKYNSLEKKDIHFEMFTISEGKNVDSIGNLRSNLMWKQFQ